MKKKKVESSRKRLILLDSHAILHRAYHAIPDFATKAGEPTGALYGLSMMLVKSVEELRPDYMIACRDLPGGTFRHAMTETYKATRTKIDDALIQQLEQAPEIFKAFGVPVYCAKGFEADDCLGTIVHQLRDNDEIEIIIVSGDMDILQLVNEKVSVYTFKRSINETVTYTPEKVFERYCFMPNQVVDYKALRGDTSDNIPGIKGIGEKTATDLITIFGSLDNLYKELEKNIDDVVAKGVKPRIASMLLEGKKDAYFSRELATIVHTAPIDFVVPDKEWKLTDYTDQIVTLCERFEFNSIKSKILTSARRIESTDVSEGESKMVTMEVDHEELQETSLALWLLHSDTTNPSLDDILAYAPDGEFSSARKTIYEQLKSTPTILTVYETIERPLIPITNRMHTDGVHVDRAILETLAREYTIELNEISAQIFKHAGHDFNINSPKQLGVVLYDELLLAPKGQKKTAGGARTTREDELVKMEDTHAIIPLILSYRELQKLLSTYIEKLPALIDGAGRLHATFVSSGTTTGRMASIDPNLQNIPVKTESGRKIRNAFTAPEGKILAAIDYSQIELRIAAGLSGDEHLLEIFKNGEDVHTATAARVFNVPLIEVDKEMRRRAKIINFGILYGMGVNALRGNLGNGVTRDEAATYLEHYFKTFSGIARYIEDTKVSARNLGYTETLYGRRRYFDGLKSSSPMLVAQAERMAINAPIQGTQADIIKLAMIEADQYIAKNNARESIKLVLQVHDELVYEMNEKKSEQVTRELRTIMESVVDSTLLKGVPILAEASIGNSWGMLGKIAR